jgi:hypothetical protein
MVALYRRGQRGSLSIRDNDYDRRLYRDPSQGAPPPQSDANRFGGGSSIGGGVDLGGGSGSV